MYLFLCWPPVQLFGINHYWLWLRNLYRVGFVLPHAYIHTHTHILYIWVCVHECVCIFKNASDSILYILLSVAFPLEFMFNPIFNWGQIFVFTVTFHLWIHVNVCCKSVQLLLYVTQIIYKMTPWANIFYFTNG